MIKYLLHPVSVIIAMLFLNLNSYAQPVLVLERPGTIKNYKYYPGGDMRLKYYNDSVSLSYRGCLYLVSDSCIWLDVSPELRLDKITNIYRERYCIMIAQKVCVIAGLGYIILDSFNRLINKENPVVVMDVVKTGGLITGCGLVLYPLRTRNYKLGERWRIMTLTEEY